MSEHAINIRIYTKSDCPLCDEMSEIVNRASGKDQWQIEYVDIETDEDLKQKYGQEIPVMFINGRKAFKARMTESQFSKKIEKAKQLMNSSAEIEKAAESNDQVFVPPTPLLAAFFAAVLFGFGYFIFQGIQESKVGARQLSGKLLRVQDRDNLPLQFDLEKMTGGRLKLAELKDKVVFLNFWATWCPPCVEEMPSIRSLHSKLQSNKNFEMLLVSADESWDPVRKFFGNEPAPFTVLLDPEGDIARQYGTTRFPETYVIIDGRVRGFIEGPRDWDSWFSEAYLQTFLEAR